jgi:CheY-like chemotaxis protein
VQQSAADEMPPLSSEPLPILVVDDDEAIRNLVVAVLRRERYETAEAGHGAEALDRLRERPFATMVLDLMMPVMTGIEVIRYLETHDDAGAPCVIVLSAAAERHLQQIHSPSVHAVLRKPFELPALLEAVRDCRRNHGSGRG